jgi:hypothetical protein
MHAVTRRETARDSNGRRKSAAYPQRSPIPARFTSHAAENAFGSSIAASASTA